MSDRRSIELSRRNFLALAGTASIANGYAWPQALLKALSQERGQAPPSPVVVRGNARFQILSPTVVRLEYAPAGHFIDAPSVSVVNRSWPACPFQAHDDNGWVEIATSQMRVKYKLDSGKFTPENLAVTWKDMTGERAWKPGDVDDKNLGGVPGSGDGWSSLPAVPGALSRNGYFWLDDSGTAVWNATTDWPEPRPDREGAQDWYFFTYGHDYKALLRELTQLLGPIPMTPRYVFGAWYTDRCGYSSDEWLRIVYRFREEGMPLDMVVIDSPSSAAVVYRGFSWDPEQMPDPKAFFAWLRAHGVRAAVNEHYGAINRDSDQHFEQVRQAMDLPEDTKEIKLDLADKKFAQMYMDVLHKPALDMGMAFWWQDGAAESSMPGLEPTLWTRHVEYEGQERLTGKRTFMFCRARSTGVWADPTPPAWGSHRYGGYFVGDILTYWSTLDMLVPFNVRSGNILFPFVTSDVPCGIDQETLDHEFYLRGTQFGTFASICRWHSDWGMRQPWEYGEESAAIVKRFVTLRYQLLPYIYTYARLAHETGAPLVRGTYLEYPEQEPAYTFKQQYLFGQELLVAPVTQPGNGRPLRKEVYLPADEHWFDYFTGRIYAGGQVLSYECPLDRMPLFVRAGAILPLAPKMAFTEQRPLDLLILDVYAGKPATFRLYEDDGTSLDYRKQAYAWTPISYAMSAGGQHVITIGATVGRYQGQPQARRYRLQVHGLFHPARVLLRDRLLPEKTSEDGFEGWSWNPAEQITVIDLISPIDSREAVTVRLEQAGSFEDVIAVQAVRAYRARVRRTRTIVQLRWGLLLNGEFVKKEPYALRVIEGVEQSLNDLVDHPADLAARPVDFKGMTATILAAFTDHPFDSTRKLPELDPRAAKSIPVISAGAFTLDDLNRMTAEILGCEVAASATESATSWQGAISGALVRARFSYDTASIDLSPQVTYELTFPDDGPPGWEEESRHVQPDGSVIINTRAPYPPQPGPHTLRLRVTAAWGSHQTSLERELVWNGPASVDPAPAPGAGQPLP